jgi:hypothetical protein
VDEGGRRNEEKSGRGGLPPAAPRLLDALRERLRYMRYSLRTEEAYVYWARGFERCDDHDRAPDIETREPLFPCYRVTPSFTARATSAS